MKREAVILIGLVCLAGLTLGPGVTLAQEEKKQDKIQSMKMDAVVVSVTREEIRAFDAPASVILVDEEDLARSQALTLKDAIDDLPNVDFDNNSINAIQRPSIRGLGQEQVIIKIDGVRQTYRGTGGIGRNPAQIDGSLLKSVEVLRGPASAMHGSGGIGGVISMTTKDAADFLDPGQTSGVSVRAGYRSATEDYTTTLAAYGKTGEMDLLAAGTYRDLGNFHSSSPEPGDDKFERNGYSGSTLFKTVYTPDTDHRLALSLNTFNDKMESGTTLYRSEEQRVTGSWDWVRDDGLVDLKASLQFTRRNNEFENQIRELEDDFKSFGADVFNTFSGRMSDTFDWRLTLGADAAFDQQEGTDFGAPDPSRPDAEAVDLGGFSRLEINLSDKFSLIPAVRYTHYEREADNTTARDQSDGRLSPRVTAQWSPVNWFNLFGTYAETFRAPSMDDIYFELEFPMPPGMLPIRVIPNPNLRPETAETFEAGFSLKFDRVFTGSNRFRFKAVAFSEKVFDFITPGVDPVITPTAIEFTNINVGEVRREGIELELGYQWGPFSFDAAYGLVNGEDRDSDEKTGTVPQNLVLSLGWDLPEQNLSLYWKSRLVDSTDYVLFQDRDEVPGYAVHGVGLVWTPSVPFSRHLRVDFGVDNLFDKEYVNYRGGVDKGLDVKFACTLAF